jgi:hypothetical protein
MILAKGWLPLLNWKKWQSGWGRYRAGEIVGLPLKNGSLSFVIHKSEEAVKAQKIKRSCDNYRDPKLAKNKEALKVSIYLTVSFNCSSFPVIVAARCANCEGLMWICYGALV